MEKTRFVELLNQWEALQSTSVEELQRLSDQYPWFQALNLILLKRLHMENHNSFQNTLERISISVPDRSILYNLLFQDKGLQKPLKTGTKEPEMFTIIKGSFQGTTEKQEPSGQSEPTEQTNLTDSKAEQEAAVSDEQIQKETSTTDPPGKGDLIEKFIESEPRIVPKEGEFKEAVAIAKQSNILYLDIVTETLAEVYLQQGNKTKARKIFEKLSLTIPEKSSYFAARIEELRK